MMKRLDAIKCCLIDAVECQMMDMAAVDTEELGEVIDMIKDIEQAKYYCAKRDYYLEKTDEAEEVMPMHHEVKDHESHEGHESKHRAIRREKSHDPAKKIEELERYMQEMTSDIVEMVKDATPEERQLMHNRIVALGAKIEQLNH